MSRPRLEILEDRSLPNAAMTPDVVMVYTNAANNGSYDAAFQQMAAAFGGRVAASVLVPGSADPNLPALMWQKKVPYVGPNEVVVVVAGPGQKISTDLTGGRDDGWTSAHSVFSWALGQLPVEFVPGDSAGHPQFPGVTYDFNAIAGRAFDYDPGSVPSKLQNLPGFGDVYVDQPPAPGGETLKSPNPQAAEFFFLLLFEEFYVHGGQS